MVINEEKQLLASSLEKRRDLLEEKYKKHPRRNEGFKPTNV